MAHSASRGQPAVVLVVVDASKEVDWHPLVYALKCVVNPGEKLVVLGIIDHIPTLLGSKRATDEDQFNSTNKRELEKEKKRVSHMYERELQPFTKGCDIRQVLLELIIGTGASFGSVLLHRASELQPRCMVLSRHLKSQKRWAENCNCDVYLMNKKGQPSIVVTAATITQST